MKLRGIMRNYTYLNNNKPFISVIMSVYNGERFLREAVESIINQTYDNFEFLIIDDCSTDNSYSILTEISASDGRLKILHNEKNMGLTACLNILLKKAAGELIARMDCDDVSFSERFEKQAACFESGDYDIVGCCCFETDESGNFTGERIYPSEDIDIKRSIIFYNPICHSSVMFKKSAAVECGGYDEKYATSQDYDLWYRAAAMGYRFYNIREKLHCYRSSASVNNRMSFRYRKNEFMVRLNGNSLLGVPFYKRIAAFIPFIVLLTPHFLIFKLRKVGNSISAGSSVK